MAKLKKDLGQENEFKCNNCKEKIATYLYTWGIGEFGLCEKCAKMMASNLTQDILKE